MRLRRTTFALAAAATLSLGTTLPAHADRTVRFTLDELNHSGSHATATLTSRDDGSLHVKITGSGFTPKSPHAQHIHGSTSGHMFTCPPASADKNGDGQVSTEEGLPQYGDVFVSLTTKGDTSKASGLAVDRMPVADADGNLSYERTIPAAALPAGTLDNLQHLHIVQHGLDANGNGKYDAAALGESVFARSLGVKGIPEEATNPATCGEVAAMGGVETGAGSTAGVEDAGLLALGGIALLGGATAYLLRRRIRVEA
jgi:hypothetical protein